MRRRRWPGGSGAALRSHLKMNLTLRRESCKFRVVAGSAAFDPAPDSAALSLLTHIYSKENDVLLWFSS